MQSANLVGQVLLGRFRVDSFIAAGGMGAVYKAWDQQRSVYLAMKVLNVDLADDPAAYRHFVREAEDLKKLTHPNIVPFYGLYEDGYLHFLLEAFVDGLALNQLLRTRGRLALAEALEYLRALSAALGYAHSLHVVHADVKPGNVMRDRSGAIYLTDFGVSRHTDTMTTTSFGPAGTPAYMAPEQVRGEKLTPAADIYALGVVFFEMVTGRRPFLGTEAGLESYGETSSKRVLAAHLYLPPPDPRGINPNLPPALTPVLLKALAKNPADRYPGMEAFYQAAAAVLGDAGLPGDTLHAHRPVEAEQSHAPLPTVKEAVARGAVAPHAATPPAVAPHAPISQAMAPGAAAPPAAVPRAAVPRRIPLRWIGVALLLFAGFSAVGIFLALWLSGTLSNLNWGRDQVPVQPTALSLSIPTSPAPTDTQETSIPAGAEEASLSPTAPAATLTAATLTMPPVTPSPTPANAPPAGADRWVSPVDGMELVRIPAGAFLMGSNTSPWDFEEPEHTVTLAEYWIDKIPVTNAMFTRYIEATGYVTTAEKNGWGYVSPGQGEFETQGANWRHPFGPQSDLAGKENYPVVQVTWHEAQAYCTWAGRRLLTEAEWEKAARGGDGRIYPWGSAVDCSRANYSNKIGEYCTGGLTPVDAYPSGASPYDVLDMTGNTWDWVADWYQADYYRVSPAENPTGPTSGEKRVHRGGAWYNFDLQSQPSYRYSNPPERAFSSVGFRCGYSD